MREDLSAALLARLGVESFIALVEAFGGTRLYIPPVITPDNEIAQAIGMAAAQELSRRYAPDQLRIPLARELRARHYRAHNFSNAQIARKLGLTEPAVNKIFARMDQVPAKGSAQLLLDI